MGFTPKEFPSFWPLPLKNSTVPQLGGGVDFLKSPSFLISGSGGRPAREGLLSLAARQIYRRNFPPVGLIQSETVLLTRRQSNWLTPYET